MSKITGPGEKNFTGTNVMKQFGAGYGGSEQAALDNVKSQGQIACNGQSQGVLPASR